MSNKPDLKVEAPELPKGAVVMKKVTPMQIVPYMVLASIVTAFFVSILFKEIYDDRLYEEVSGWREYIDEVQESHQLALTETYADAFRAGQKALLEEQAEEKGLSLEPFQPVTSLSKNVEARALAIATWAEARGDADADYEYIAWAIVNRAIDTRDSYIYQDSIAAVTVADTQFEPMGPYKKVIENLVWGKNLNYVPKAARKAGTPDNIAWKKIVKLTEEIMNGERPRITLANHFWAPRSMSKNRIPDFAKYLKPLKTVGGHIIYVDYMDIDGKRVYFTKANPYNPRKHK